MNRLEAKAKSTHGETFDDGKKNEKRAAYQREIALRTPE